MVECFLVAFLLWDPGIYFKHPFSSLESSTASQTVHVASGLIGQYSPSWCHGVAFPLMPGFAKKLWFQIAKFGPNSYTGGHIHVPIKHHVAFMEAIWPRI